MKHSLAFLAVAAVAFAVGCSAPPHHPEGHHGGEHHDHDHKGNDHHEHGGKEHHKREFQGGMKAFHDVLAPAYHMDKTPARSEKACGAVASMKDAAAKIAAEPSGDPAIWKAKADALAQNVDGLDKACKVDGKADVPAKFELVHDAFHGLVEAQKLRIVAGRPGASPRGPRGGAAARRGPPLARAARRRPGPAAPAPPRGRRPRGSAPGHPCGSPPGWAARSRRRR